MKPTKIDPTKIDNAAKGCDARMWTPWGVQPAPKLSSFARRIAAAKRLDRIKAAKGARLAAAHPA